MKIISFCLLMWSVSRSMSRMPPVAAMDYVDAVLKQEKRKQHNDLAIQYLEGKKVEVERRYLSVAATATADQFA